MPLKSERTHHNAIGTRAAYIAAAVFAISLARFFVLPRLGSQPDSLLVAELNGGLPIVAHLLLLPIVAATSSPAWARAAGYGWLAIDVTSDSMALQGVADSLYLPVRYGGHLFAAVWIGMASWNAGGAARWIGLLLAAILGIYSFIPHGPIALLIPSGALLPLWLVLLGQRLAS